MLATANAIAAVLLLSAATWQSELSIPAKVIGVSVLVIVLFATGLSVSLLGRSLRQYAGLSVFEKAERKRMNREKETKESLSVVAFFVGLVGFFRILTLFSAKTWNSQDGLGPGGLLVALSGPCVLVGAIVMSNAKFYSFSIAASVLCMISGNPLSILLGIIALSMLVKEEVRSLFANRIKNSLTQASPVNATLPYDSTKLGGIRLKLTSFLQAGSKLLQSLSESMVRAIQGVLILVHLFCMLLLFSFSSQYSSSDEKGQNYLFAIGSPEKWISFQISDEKRAVKNAAGAESHQLNSKVAWGLHPNTPFYWTLLLAVLTCILYGIIQAGRNPAKNWRDFPAFTLKAWALIFVSEMLLAVTLGALMMQKSRARTPSTTAPSVAMTQCGSESLTNGMANRRNS